MQPDFVFSLIILIISVVLHEVSHGYMANYLGDPTARLAGRLTLNPLRHLDPVGSVFLPVLLSITHSPFLIGYAKPVPYNPYNLRGKHGEAWVAAAGPASNLLLALFFGLCIRFGGVAMTPPLMTAFATITYINVLLALFNLIPLSPLDGSKVLPALLPRPLEQGYTQFRHSFERLGFFSGLLIIMLVFYFCAPFFNALVASLFTLITGTGL